MLQSHRMSSSPRYAELHCKTNFSFLRGASHPDELVAQAAQLGYTALAITDHNSLAGVVRAHTAAKEAGLKVLIGAEITPEDAPTVLLYAPDAKAYGRLARLITQGRRSASKGESLLYLSDVADHADGLLAAVILPSGPVSDSARQASELRSLSFYREIFAGRCYLTVALHRGPNDETELERFVWLAKQAAVPLVASNDVHYHDPGRRPLHDVLTAIRHGLTVAELGSLRFPNGERYLKSPAEMNELFSRYPAALAHGLELADRCHFSLDELRYEYPEELCPPGTTAMQHLTRLSWEGAAKRYPGGVPEKVALLLQQELRLIEELRYETYFLTVWDLVEFARRRGILCQGRGSAANSAVCFCLDITSVDPERTDVLFERFVSRERNEPPDIDVDFEHERREEVIQYVYQKYGRDRAGIVAEVITYRVRSAVRDVGKALGLSLDRVDRLAKALDDYEDGSQLPERIREAGLDPDAPGTAQLLRLTTELLGFPRHLSQHVGGFVITRGPLSELVPIENAAMPDRTVIQWDKDDLDALDILKVDCLALGMLTAIRKCFDLIARHYNVELTLANVPAEDPAVYDMIGRADTVGVFQIESRAQMSMLPRLLPRCFYDLVIEVAIVRPGPIQGGMVHPYLRRRSGQEPVTYPNAVVEQVLSKTLGVPLFQEQVMRLAMAAAGFTPGEADKLRRAMGAWRRPGLIEQFRGKLRDGMLSRGLPAAFAEQLYEQIRGFGEYGFPEAHAASFALLAYVSAWLKCHYPAAFAAAILNSQPMGFYAPAQIVRDARNHGVTVVPVDVNSSEWDCTLEGGRISKPSYADETGRIGNPSYGEKQDHSLRLGFRLIKGLPQAKMHGLVEARSAGQFRSISDCARAMISRPIHGLTVQDVDEGPRKHATHANPRSLLARLAAADAFASVGLGRRAALWQVLSTGEELPLFGGIPDEEDAIPCLPKLEMSNEVTADYDTTGLSLKAHPIGFLRRRLAALGVIPASALADASHQAVVRVAGLVLVRQRPATAKGTIFVTLEDETGTVNLVAWPSIWQRYRQVARSSVALLVEGKVERSGSIVHVNCQRLEDLSHALRGLACQSRNFR